MSDIQRGNEGIDLGTWTGWDGPNERPPLPQYPQPWDLPERPPTASNDRDRMLVRSLGTHQCRRPRWTENTTFLLCVLIACMAFWLRANS